MKRNEYYTLVKSTLPNHQEVVVTYVDVDGKTKHEFIYIETRKKAKNSYYIAEAQKQFAKRYNVDETQPVLKVKRKPRTIILTALAITAVVATSVSLAIVFTRPGEVIPEKDEFEKITEYYRDYIINNTNIDYYKDLSADEIMNRIYLRKDDKDQPVFSTLKTKRIAGVDTYYIDGINYNDGTERDAWTPGNHVSQAKAIAVTATVNNDPKIMDVAVRMTYFWVFNNFRSTNWWHNELGAGANYLADLGLFVYDHLDSKGKAMLVSKVANASFYYRPSLLTHSGTNLIDYADITLRSSAFTKNKQEFNVAVNRIEEELTDKHTEGFQPDGTFFQHGKHVQITSYGKEGIIRLAKVLRAISSAGHKFPREKMEVVEKFLLRGMRDMTHKGYINYSAGSRAFCRRNNLITAENNFKGLREYIILPDFERNEELEQYLDNLDKGRSTFSGIDYFDNAHIIAANLDDLYISFKGTDYDMTNTECVNEENRLGLNLSYGTNTCVMDTGKEYNNISALWNYAYIPGTTSINLDNSTEDTHAEDFVHPEYNDKALLALKGNKYYKDELFENRLDENGIYGGGIYPENNKANDLTDTFYWSMQRSSHHKENTFAVGCIASPNYGVILIGADLSYDGTTSGNLFNTPRTLHTTIEQCFYDKNKAYSLSDDKKVLNYGNATYKILEGCDKTITVQDEIFKEEAIKISDAWNRNRNRPTTEAKKEEKGGILLAYIQHGNAIDGETVNKYNYAYSIQPKSIANNPNIWFEVVNNFENKEPNKGWEVQEILIHNGDKITDIILPYNNGGMTDPTYKPYISDERVRLRIGEIYAKDTTQTK